MMKQLIMTMALGILAGGMQAAEYDYLVFKLTDGTTQAVTSSNLTMTFSDGTLTVSNGTETLYTVAASLLQSMEFSADGTTTAITTITADALTTDGTAEIYDMGGRRMPGGTALPKGVYIIKRNGKTFKTVVK